MDFAIKKHLFEEILIGCKNAFPLEFGALLILDKSKTHYEKMIIAPAKYFEDSVDFDLFQLPISVKFQGTIHSHPYGMSIPSKQDLHLYSKLGGFHLIISDPFTLENSRAFDSQGKSLKIVLV